MLIADWCKSIKCFKSPIELLAHNVCLGQFWQTSFIIFSPQDMIEEEREKEKKKLNKDVKSKKKKQK